MIYHANANHKTKRKNAVLAILTSYKDFKARSIITNKFKCFIMIKSSVHQKIKT